MQEFVGHLVNNNDISHARRLKHEISALDLIQSNLEILLHKSTVLRLEQEGELVKRWQELAHEISEVFRETMKGSEEHPLLRYSNAGPVARFVAAVIPCITGDNPTIQAVAQHLKRLTRRSRDNSAT